MRNESCRAYIGLDNMAGEQTAARKRHASDVNDVVNRVSGSTKKGKKLKIGQDTNGYFYITFVDGGKLPKMLYGRFVRYDEAENKIKLYLKE